MAAGSGRLDFGIVGLTLLTGSALSMGFIQLLAGPLEEMSTLSVQALAIQISALAAPLLVSLLMVLRQGPRLVALGPAWHGDLRRCCCGCGCSRHRR